MYLTSRRQTRGYTTRLQSYTRVATRFFPAPTTVAIVECEGTVSRKCQGRRRAHGSWIRASTTPSRAMSPAFASPNIAAVPPPSTGLPARTNRPTASRADASKRVLRWGMRDKVAMATGAVHCWRLRYSGTVSAAGSGHRSRLPPSQTLRIPVAKNMRYPRRGWNMKMSWRKAVRWRLSQARNDGNSSAMPARNQRPRLRS